MYIIMIRKFFFVFFLLNVTVFVFAKDTYPASKLPQRVYPSTLDEQLKALKDDPQVKFFNQNRVKLGKDPYRPIYHFSSPESILHDPNGLCFWQGKWHLFYQYIPAKDYRQHWGHAVSDDLIHWIDLPVALYPVPENMVYSGATFVEEGRVVAMYNGVGIGTMVAVSSDPLLLNWEKIAIPALTNIDKSGNRLPFSVGDANIWKIDDTYYSVTGGGRKATGPGGLRMRESWLFSSKDLVNWTPRHEFMVNERFLLPGDDAACPYFWPIGNQYIFFLYSHMTGGQYLIGDYDKEKQLFYPKQHGKSNFMSFLPGGVHAPSAYPDGDGGVVVLYNMHQGTKTLGWRGITTLPRRFSMTPEQKLRIEPYGNYKSLRTKSVSIAKKKLHANKEIILPEIKGNAYELIIEVDVKESPMFELNILRSPEKEEFTSIKFFKDRGFPLDRLDSNLKGRFQSIVSVETAYSSILPDVKSRAPEIAPVVLEKDEKLKLHVFVDKSVVEVFVNDKQAISVRVYPGREDSHGISLRSQGGDAELISLNFWQMKSIYNELKNDFILSNTAN